jgi:hypothetical protein
VVPVTAGSPHPAFQPVVRAFDPDWITAYRITSADMPRADGDDAIWVLDVPAADVATVSDWCSPFPGRHGFYPFAFRGQAVQQPLVPLAAFTDAWDSDVVDLDLSQVDPVLALMVTMRTGTLNDAGALPDGCKPRLLTATGDDVPALAELALTGAAETRPSAAASEIRHMRGLHTAPGVPAVPEISTAQPLERTRHGMRRLIHARARPRSTSMCSPNRWTSLPRVSLFIRPAHCPLKRKRSEQHHVTALALPNAVTAHRSLIHEARSAGHRRRELLPGRTASA